MSLVEDVERESTHCPSCQAELSKTAKCPHCESPICPVCNQCPIENCQEAIEEINQTLAEEKELDRAIDKMNQQAEMEFEISEFEREKRLEAGGDSIPWDSQAHSSHEGEDCLEDVFEDDLEDVPEDEPEDEFEDDERDLYDPGM